MIKTKYSLWMCAGAAIFLYANNLMAQGNTFKSTPESREPVSPTAPVAAAQPDEIKKIDKSMAQQWAVGFNLGWLSRRDYGARDYRRFSPELLGYYYIESPWAETYWRAGTRLGYANGQPEMPRAVRIEETDTTFSVEAGILREWYVVPSLAWGIGYDFRTTKVKTSEPIESADDRLNRKENLLLWYVQTGVGLPLYYGMFMIEPTVRYQSIEYDDRSNWYFGFESTFGF